MELYNGNISNALLAGAMQLMKAENSSEHMTMLLRELDHSKLITPVALNPGAEETPSGDRIIPKGARVEFPMVSTREGKRFFVAFTDKMSYDNAVKPDGGMNLPARFNEIAVITFEELSQMMVLPENPENLGTAGLILNPVGENIVVARETAAMLMTKKMELMNQAVDKLKAEGKIPQNV